MFHLLKCKRNMQCLIILNAIDFFFQFAHKLSYTNTYSLTYKQTNKQTNPNITTKPKTKQNKQLPLDYIDYNTDITQPANKRRLWRSLLAIPQKHAFSI